MDRMGHIARGVVLLVIIGALFGNQATAQPIKAPYVITSPGMYELSEDARGLTDTYGIKIECSNVVLDGGGHFLGGDNRDQSVGVYANLYGGSITNVTVKNFLLEDWETGIGYNYVKGQDGDTNLIENCNVVKSGTAIHVQYSDYVTVSDNSINDCSTGIVVDEHSTFSSTDNNEIKSVGLGMSVTQSADITIEENNINTCEVYGLEVVDSDTVSVIKNAISDNKYAALRVENSEQLNITGNNFSKTTTGAVLLIGNEVHKALITNNWFGSYEDVSVDDVSSGIIWNSTQTPGTNILGGPYLGGNYWGSAPDEKGFSDKAPDADGFGIADNPYQINDKNVDYLPLTHTTATKAPEEQVDNMTEAVISEQEQDIDLSNQTMTLEVPVVSVTNPLPVSPNPEQNETSIIIPAISTQNQTLLTKDPEIVVTNTSPIPSTSVKNVTAPILVNENLNQTNITQPAQNVPDQNTSIMNQSVANAYPSISPEPSEEKTSDIDLTTTKNMTPPDNQTNGSEVTGQDSGSSPASVGYLLFTSSESKPRVILTTSSGTDVTLDPIDGNNLTVPVPVEEKVYTRYRVEKDGFTPVTGNITPYPGSGQTTTFPIVLIRSTDNATSQQMNQPSPISPSPIPVQVSPPQANQTPKSPTPTVQTTDQEHILNNTQGVDPVISNNTQSIVVTNGVTTEESKKSHVITATAGPGGAVFPQGDVQIQDGGSIAFTINPNDGKRIAYLVIDGIQTSPMSEYRFINVTSDHVIVGGFT
ncbi:MAG: NosD domain-containing protein [Methanobacteriota archaeon]